MVRAWKNTDAYASKCEKFREIMFHLKNMLKYHYWHTKAVSWSRQWYPGPRGFSRFFYAWEPRSGESESRSGEKEKPLVTFDLNLTFMPTPGSGSDPRALIGWYFYNHANQYDWFVWLPIPRGRRGYLSLHFLRYNLPISTREGNCL